MNVLNKIALLLVLMLCHISYTFAQEETRAISAFKKIDVSGMPNVFLQKGSSESVRVETRNFDLHDVTTEVKSNTLYIKTHKQRGNRYKDKEVNVYITYVSLEKITASGASDIEIEDGSAIKVDNLDIYASGASDISLDIDVKDLRVDISGASDLDLKGVAQYQDVIASGAADFNAYKLKSEEAYISTSGSADAFIHVQKVLKAKAQGSSDIHYRGEPTKVNVKSSGAADILKR